MKSLPLVSVNVRTFNNDRTIGKTLESIKNQTYKKIEVLISDQYSKDDTIKIARKYKVRINFANKFEDPRIKNYERSKGKYIFSVDSDQVLDNDAVEKCVELAEKRKLDAITISEKSLIIKNSLVERLIAYDKWVIDKNQDDDFLFGTACPRFFRKDFLRNVKWPAKFSMFDDALLYEDMLSKNAKVAYLRSSSIWHHEVTSWTTFIKKFHKYGKSYVQAFQKKPKTVAAHSLPRRSYFSKAAFTKPLYFLGLLLLYLVKSTTAMIGALSFVLENNFPKMVKFIQRNIGILVSCLLVFLVYVSMLNGFFQQDEWSSFAYNFSIPVDNVIWQSFAPNAGHYQPLNTLFLYFLVSVFKINYLPYAAVSVLLHLVNVALVFTLMARLYKNRWIAFATALLFGVLVSTYQATTWVMADLGIHLATIFALISLISFIDFLTKKHTKYFLASLVTLVISLLFKEIAIGFFVFLPMIFFMFADKKLKRQSRFSLIILTAGAIYLVFRVLMLNSPTAYSRDTLVFSSQSQIEVVCNVLSYPFKALSQSIIPASTLIEVAKFVGQFFPTKIAGRPDTTEFDVFTQKYVLETVSFSLFALALGVCLLVLRRQEIKDKKIIAASFLFVFLNGLIYGLSPERTGITTILDSRNLYFVSIASSFLIVWLIWKLGKFTTRQRIIIFVIVAILNIFFLEAKINELVSVAGQRKMIINNIKRDYPILPDRVVIYTESDASFYGLPITEKILPFQSGFGQTLLMIYYDNQDYSPELTSKRFLWELTDQGYKEVGNKGFGYYRDFSLLKKSLIDNKLSSDSVIAFKYNSQTQSLVNITASIRQRLNL